MYVKQKKGEVVDKQQERSILLLLYIKQQRQYITKKKNDIQTFCGNRPCGID